MIGSRPRGTAKAKCGFDATEVMSWIEGIVACGERPPGSAGDRASRNYIKRQLRSFGFSRIEVQPFPVSTCTSAGASLVLHNPETAAEHAIACHPMPFAQATGRPVEASLVHCADTARLDAFDLSGRILDYDHRPRLSEPHRFKDRFFVYDPDDTIRPDEVATTWNRDRQNIVAGVAAPAGARALIGLLDELPWESDRYMPQLNNGIPMPIPGIWLGPSSARRFRELQAAGLTDARLEVDARHGTSESENFWVDLPGDETDGRYIVLSHHDSYFDGAVQDASGSAVVLGLARHFAGLAADARPRRAVRFLFIGAHTHGRMGERLYAAGLDAAGRSQVALAVAAEHIGRAVIESPGPDLELSRLPAPRLLLTAGAAPLERLLENLITDHDYRRSAVVPQSVIRATSGRSRGVAGELCDAGLPVVGLLAGAPYLFFKEDTPAAVAVDQLVPTIDLLAVLLYRADRLSRAEIGGDGRATMET